MPRRFALLLCMPLVVTATAVVWFRPVAQADDPLILPKENKALAGRLTFARKLVVEQKWAEAIETYAGILRDVGDKLSPVETPLDAVSSTNRSLQIRLQCHLDIAAFPKKALQQYRATVKAQTKQWLETGIANRDEQPLLKIVREAFCATAGEQALAYLGDLAFEKGEFHQALAWWRFLAVPPTEATEKEATPGRLLFPEPQGDLAGVRAKMILAHLFDGNEFQAKAEYAAFQKLHADAAGHFAGTQGNYAKLLKQWLDKGSPTFGRDLSWPTFAGNAARNAALPKLPHQRLWSDGPTWSVSLVEKAAEESFPPPKSLSQLARELPYYPIILDKRVLLSNGRAVLLFDLFTGQKLDTYTLPPKLALPPPKPASDKTLSRHTLAASGNKVFAVLGAARFGPVKNGERGKAKSYLTCLELAGKGPSNLNPLWHVRADEQQDEAAIFEGTPLVHGDRVYVIHARAKGLQITASICCFNANTGKQLWQEDLAKFTEAEDDHPPAVVDQPLLTLAGNRIVFCSQRGVLQAVDAGTGAQAWAVKYPSRGPITIEGTPSPRELGTCLFADGRVYAAPMDSDRLLCLDAATGQVQWERDRIQAVHLLGCHHGKLLFTTADGLRSVDARTGSDSGGWLQPAAGRLPPFGRGVLLGDWLFWPTQHPEFPLRVVHIASGLPHGDGQTFSPVQIRQIKPGNLAFANGCLVVAGPTDLTGYVAPKLLLKQHEKDAGGPKPAPEALYKLAQSEADAGLIDAALKHFKQAEKATIPETWEKELFQWKCLTARHDLLMMAARGQPLEKAIKFLDTATKLEFPANKRLEAHVELAARWLRSAEPAKCVLAYQRILDDEELRDAAIWWVDDWLIRGRDLAIRGIWDVILKDGRDAYEQVEKEAKQLASTAVGVKTIPILEQLLRRYPHSYAAQAAWPKLVKAYEVQGNDGVVTDLLRGKFVSKCGDEDETPKLIVETVVSLAKLYEKQGYWEGAQFFWSGLEEYIPSAGLKEKERNKLNNLIKQHLALQPYDEVKKSLLAENLNSDLQLPLSKQWQVTANGAFSPAQGVSVANRFGLLFALKGGSLSCHTADTGALRWTRILPFTPTWIGIDANRVIAAGPRGIAGLRLENGIPIWSWTTEKPLVSVKGNSVIPPERYSVNAVDTLVDFNFAQTPPGECNGRATALSCYLNGWMRFYVNLDTGQVCFSPADWNPFVGIRPPIVGLESHSTQSYPVTQLAGPSLMILAKKNGGIAAYFKTIQEGTWGKSNPSTVKAEVIASLDEFSAAEWTYAPRLPTALTGELPRLFTDKKSLLTLLPRNYGYDLERIDPKTGDNLWKPAARLCDKAFGRDAVAFHEKAVYYASGDTLFARDLGSGNLLWKRALPESVRGWRVQATKQALMVFPGALDEPKLHKVPLGAFTLTIPTRLKPKYPFCLQVHDYKAGQLLQRLDFDGDVTGAGIQFFPDSIVVTSGGKAYGLRGQKKG